MEGKIKSRGYLPHWEIPGACQFLTWRLHDALDPEEWQAWRETYRKPEERAILMRLAERRMDEGRGEAHLKNPRIARIAMEEILKGHGKTYSVLAATVMPNHVHAVLLFSPEVKMADAIEQIKGASSRFINQALGRKGRLWQPDYFDRLIRNADHGERCIRYTHWNPVKANLVTDPTHHQASTANEHWKRRLEEIERERGL